MKVVGLRHEQHDGALGLVHQIAQRPLAVLALGQDARVLFRRQVVEERRSEGDQAGAVLVHGQRLGHGDALLGDQVGLQLAQQQGLARADQGCEGDQLAGVDGGTEVAEKLPVVGRLVEAGRLRVAGKAEVFLDLG